MEAGIEICCQSKGRDCSSFFIALFCPYYLFDISTNFFYPAPCFSFDFRHKIRYNTNQKVFGSVLRFFRFVLVAPTQLGFSARGTFFFYALRKINYLRGVFFCLYFVFPPVTGTFSRGNVSNIFPIRFLSKSTGSNSSLSFCKAERFPTKTFG